MKRENTMIKETFYFSHDYNARNDIKIKRLIVKHGYEGYGLYWALIEELYQNANALPLDYDCIAYDFRTNSNMIESLIKDFDLFEVGEDIFSSLSIQRRLGKRMEISEKRAKAGRISAEKRKKERRTEHVLKCVEQIPTKESKVKESKVKDNKVKDTTNTNTVRVFNFKKSLLDYGFNELLVDEWLVIRKQKKAINSEFSFNAFIKQIEKAGAEKNEVMRTIAEKQWAGFNHAWMKNTNNNFNGIENETDRRNRESAERKQEIYEYARSVGMVGGEEKQDIADIW